jgi:lipopolysaccharide biosynthesis glycosyltransferase
VSLNDYILNNFDTKYRLWEYNCAYRFDLFLIKGYEKIVYFDSDIIFQNNIENFISPDIEFGAARRTHINQIEGRKGFNAGLMVLDEKYLLEDTKTKLLKIYNSQPPLDKNVLSRKWVGNEPIFNTYFLDKKIAWLPKQINCCTDEITPDVDINVTNLHFIGSKKPWQSNKLKEQFDSHIVDSFIKNNGKFLYNIKLRKLRDRFLYYQKKCNEILS